MSHKKINIDDLGSFDFDKELMIPVVSDSGGVVGIGYFDNIDKSFITDSWIGRFVLNNDEEHEGRYLIMTPNGLLLKPFPLKR